ncbi:amino acid racemase [Candidatus Woesearchaeota archaeon]|nr:amino acid racemase [Candidatus Woesearchaeota archaeon]
MIYGGNLRIGVLGGIGPEATGEYYLKLIKGLQQSGLIRDNTDFPYIIVHSIPAPELVGKNNSQYLEPYKAGLMAIDKSFVDAIIMVCNTIHLHHAELQKETTAPIMDLRQKVKERLARDGVKKIAVIGTPSTISEGLYRFDGIDYVVLTEQEIDGLSSAIFKYNKGEDQETQKRFVENIARQTIGKGAEAVVLGCTEFAVMLKDSDIPKIDTLDVLVDATIDFYRGTKTQKFSGRGLK